jgi:hypothetical protein
MDYHEQLARVRRFLVRVETSSVNPKLELPPEKQTEYEDMLCAFFQNCWHLKDWIKNDAAAPTTLAGPIEQLCTQYQSLMLCADIANASKHLKWNRPPRLGGKVVPKIMVRLTDSFETGESTSQVRYVYEIADDVGKSYDALTLARQALSDWETLITTHGGAI